MCEGTTQPAPERRKKIGWDCADDDCARTAEDGPLYRINPKGERGVFMCAEHAGAVS